MILGTYASADRLRLSLKDAPQYVRFVKGPRTGSIAEVISVTMVSFNRCDFKARIQGTKEFTTTGQFIEHMPDYDGPTVLIRCEEPDVDVLDFMGRIISVNCLVMFPKINGECRRGAMDMVLGNVRRINSKNGSIFIQPLKVGDDVVIGSDEGKKLIMLKTSSRAIILDKQMLTDLVQFKLHSGFDYQKPDDVLG